MPLNRTEMAHDMAAGLDTREPQAIAAILARAQVEAAEAASAASGSIASAAQLVARCLADGGRMAYAGAGSSGLIALCDALELPGTFGIARDRIEILYAGGLDALSDLQSGAEDDLDLARQDMERAELGAGDCLVAVSASGATPYTLMALETARSLGVATIALANNAAAPMLETADIAVLLDTPPEVVAGSTRMGAGTAQKIALNMLSTLTAICLGHVHDGQMVNVRADNAKLKQRAARIVAVVARTDDGEATACLDRAGGSVKHAILLAAGAGDLDAAAALLARNQMRLRPALGALAEHDSAGTQGP